MRAAIEVRDLTKAYDFRKAVDAVSFQVEPGEAVALLGPNGSGKTTSLRCIAGLARPDQGSILIEGIDISGSPRQAREKFCFLPQEAVFPPNLTAAEIVVFHCRLRRVPESRASASLEEAGIPPHDQERPVSTLSGGMRQRVSLAVAGLSAAPVTLLDEPTASLDPEAAVRLRELARVWKNEGRALLFSTHVLADLEDLADRVVVLVDGRVVAQESVAKLKSDVGRLGILKVDVGHPEQLHIDAALAAGATEARLNSHSILITSPMERRFEILRSLSQSTKINHFESSAIPVEKIYLNYVRNGCKN